MNERRGFTLTDLLIVVGVFALLIALLAPAVNEARESARRSASRGHLKQWALTLYNYEDVYRRLPPGGWVAGDDEQHGWVTLTLPYLESSPLYSSFDFGKPWHHPRNQPICRVVIETARYPHSNTLRTAEGYGLMHYAANANLMHRNSSTRFDEITAGLGNTLMVGEIPGEFRPWACAWNWRTIGSRLNSGPAAYGHDGRNVTDFVLADGQLKSINNEIDPDVLMQLASGGLSPRSEDLAIPPIPAAYPATKVQHPYVAPRKGEEWIPPSDTDQNDQ